MPEVQIQPASDDQTDAIMDVIVTAFQQYRDMLDPPSGVFNETADKIRQKLAAGGGFVAFDGSQLIGVVLYQPHQDYIYLGRLAVLPSYRGRHVASKLITAVEQEALKRKLYRVQLAVRLVLVGNQALFQRQGYQITSYHAHEGYTVFTYATMEKALASIDL